jgi:acyl-[acyl-carrier-protein]-phospholipid O-acyltransferase/long-chain-fatty-acid--[acyl-carrier-protein] ligase
MRFVAFVTRVLMRLLFRVRVYGELGRHERLLIVANHQSFVDGIALGAFLPFMPTWLVHQQQASRWFFALGLRFLPHLVVDTQSPMAIKTMVRLVEQGTPVMVFPEGRVSNTGGQMKVYDGPAFVAAKTGADVVVVQIDGLIYSKFSRMSGDFPRKWFPRVTITICPPRKIPMPEGRIRRIRRRRAAEAMRRIMLDAHVVARRGTTLHESLFEAIRLHGRGREMIEDIQGKWTFGQLLKATMALGRIATKFTRPGENVGVLLPNSGAHLALLFGLFTFKRVPAVLNFTSGADGMQHACAISQARTIITSRAFLEKARLGPLVGKLHGVEIRCLEDLRRTLTLGDKLWLLFWALRFPRRVMAHVKPDDPALILFTSGSEARPKGVVLSHSAVLANILQAKSAFDVTSKDRFFTALPMFHSLGLCSLTILPVLTGSRTFLYPTPLHYRLIPELIYDRDCTVFATTTTFLANYTKVAHPYDFHRVRLLVVGGEKLTEEVRRAAADKFGVRPVEGYGVTECAPIVAANCFLAYQPGTVGQMVPGIEYRLEPVAGIETGGVLHVRGPNLMLGYLKDDQPGVIQPPSSAFGPGWYDTGDVAAVDEDGFVTILGRVKRFAKVAGEMIALELVEKIAREASPQRQHASVSATASGRGEMILLYTEDPNLRREQVLQAARRMGAPEIAIPRKVIHLEKLPLLGNGKKDYVSLQELARAEADR